MLASDGTALQLLRAEFPDLPTFTLPSYRIRYTSPNMVRNIAFQLPRLLWAIRAEQWVTQRLAREHRLDAVLSDNRYGCFTKGPRCVLLTHQVNLKINNRFWEWPVNQILPIAFRKFDELWVPDFEGPESFAAELSHPPKSVHAHMRYIGPLSRMVPFDREPDYDVAIVLSGPEPQRSILEQKLLEQAISLSQDVILIRGKTKSREHYYADDRVEVVSYLTSRDLNDVLAASRFIVCRAGYSSIMDLAALGKKALLIPTPGQTEQEYLAQKFQSEGIFHMQLQDEADLSSGLDALPNTSGIHPARQSFPEPESYLEPFLASL